MHITVKLSLIGAVLQLWSEPQIAADPCPKSNGHLHRVGQTRFYIVHNIKSRDPSKAQSTDWKRAPAVCEKHKLKLAKIKKITTMAVVGRPLEQFVKDNKLQDTWYWMDAKYNMTLENYIWSDGEPVKFHNIIYRQPRPVGVGGHYSYNNQYNQNWKEHQCLTIALPWPGTAGKKTEYGHSTVFDEKFCGSTTKRHVICESVDPNCKTSTETNDPFLLSEDKDSYFENGNWIIGDRKYIVNWKPRFFNESVKYCTDMGMQVYTPTPKSDACLIPYIKMWSRNITASQFWTSWNYIAKKKQYQTADGKVVAKVGKVVAEEKSSKLDAIFCVASAIYYELKDQLPCDRNSGGKYTCSWNFMEYVPANCEVYLGTICQHQDFENRDCKFESWYISDVNKALTVTATVPFGFPNNTQVYRSRYKQTFGSLVCPEGFLMVRSDSTMWYANSKKSDGAFVYDYRETYWVVDEGGFNKTTDSKCTVSKPKTMESFGPRELVTVPCTEWHFYVCEKVEWNLVAYNGTAVQTTPIMKWNKTRQPRIYPILKSS